MTQTITCFKAYDVRGRIPDQLNEDIAYRIGRAYAEFLQPKKVVVGHDIRLSSPQICEALSKGLLDAGVNVSHIGQCGTEEIYFATSHLKMDGGIVVTASHNPKDYNGMKFVRENSKPISSDTGLEDIRALAEEGVFSEPDNSGELQEVDVKDAYIEHLLSYIDPAVIKPLKIVCNAGNGGAGQIIDLLETHLPVEFIKVQHEADGHFPKGVPNPLLQENRQPTIDAILEHDADLGIAWDGDFDRCFFFDEKGTFIEGYYIVGLLAEAFLKKQPGGLIIHDPRLCWNTEAVVQEFGGKTVLCKSGHAFIKEKMRQVDAVYGGEMSAHHYFRDFYYCDSGMVPWLLVLEILSRSNQPFSSLVQERMAAFPASGEINREVADAQAAIDKVQEHYTSQAQETDFTDGLSMDMGEWRFNLRKSNTEPVIRLNVESRADPALMQCKTDEILNLLAD
ncbi:MAG: phosphomannomutase [Gammaproteobacteria bacterium]|nr:phosphomannomutase [Gammaproteobacteria bacterium]MAY02023.1 phosphomannomutase [Gammaproteobacteria bacterium]